MRARRGQGADELVQLVHRRRPRELYYLRSAPVTMWLPTPAQAEVRRRFGNVAREAGGLTARQVAERLRRIGHRVSLHRGELLRVDGRVLPKAAAYMLMLRDWRSDMSMPRVPKWVRRLAPMWAALKPAPAEKKLIMRTTG